MKIITKYILKEFSIPFFLSLCIFCVIFLISEFFFRLPDFVHHHASFLFILKYLIAWIPVYTRDSLPLSCLAGVVFSFSKFNKYNELIALKSCGINIKKIIYPLILAGFFLSLIGIFLNYKIVPDTYRITNIMREQELKKNRQILSTQLHNLLYSGIDGEKFTIKLFDVSSETMFDVTIDYFTPDSLLFKQIKTKKMFYRNNKWIVENAIIRDFDSKTQELIKEEYFKKKELNLKDLPQDFLPPKENIEELSFVELKNEIRRLKLHLINFSKELTHYYFRISYPCGSLVIIFFIIPISFNLSHKYSKFRGIGFIIFVSFIYWLLISFFRVLGESGNISPVLSAWIPNIIFFISGIILLKFSS